MAIRIADLEAAMTISSDLAPRMAQEGAVVDAAVNQMNQKAATLADPFNAAFNQVAANAAAGMGSATQVVASAAAQMGAYGPQITQPFTQAFTDLSGYTQSALAGASSALRVFGQEGAAAAGQLASSQVQVQGALGQVSAALREETAALNQMISQQQSGANTSALLSSEIARTQGIVAKLTQEEATLAAASGRLNSALRDQAKAALDAAAGHERVAGASRSSAAAQSAAAGASDAAAAGSQRFGAAQGLLHNLMHTTTSQISTQHSILTGYDGILQAVVRSFGGLPIIWSVAITVGLQLVNVLLKQKEEKKQNTDVTVQLINNEKTLAEIFNALRAAAGGSADALQQHAGAIEGILRRDLGGAISGFSSAFAEYAKTLAEATAAQNAHAAAVQQLGAAEAELAQLQAMVSASTTQATGLTARHIDRMEALESIIAHINSKALPQLNTSWNQASDAQEKATSGALKTIDTLIDMARATNTSSRELVSMAQNARLGADALAFLTANISEAAQAQWEWNKARDAAVKLPALDVSAAPDVLKDIGTDVNARINRDADLLKSKGIPAAEAYNQAVLANEAALKKYTDAASRKVAMDNAGTLGAKNHAAAQELLKEEISRTNPELTIAIGKIGAYEQAHKSFSDTAGRSASKVKDAYSRMARDTVQIVQEWVQSHGVQVTSLRALWNTLEPSLRASLEAQAKAWHANIAEVERAMITHIGQMQAHLARLSNLVTTLAPQAAIFDAAALQKDFDSFLRSVSEMQSRLAGGLDISGAVTGMRAAAENIISGWEEIAARTGISLDQLRKNVKQTFAELVKDAPAQAKQVTDEVQKRWVDGINRTQAALRAAAANAPDVSLIDLPALQRNFTEFANASEQLRVSLSTGLGVPEATQRVVSSAQQIITTWQSVGAQMGLTSDQVVERVTASFAELSIKAPEKAGQAARAVILRWLEEIQRGKQAIEASTKGLFELNVTQFDAAGLTQSVGRFLEAMQRVRQSVQGSFQMNDAVLQMQSAAQQIITTWVSLGEQLGLTSDEIEARMRGTFAQLAPNMSAQAQAAVDEMIARWKESTNRGQTEILEQWAAFNPALDAEIQFVHQTLSGAFDRMGADVVARNYAASIEMVKAWAATNPALRPVLAALEQNFARAMQRIQAGTLKQTEATVATVIQKYGQMRTGLSVEFNQLIGVVLSAMGKISDGAIAAASTAVSRVVRVFQTMPGGIGNSLRSTLDDIQQWVSFIDSILAVLNSIWSAIPPSVADAAAAVMGTAQQQTAVVTATASDMGLQVKAAVKDMADSVSSDVGQMTGSVISDVQTMHDTVIPIFDDMAAQAKEAAQGAAEDTEKETQSSLASIGEYAQKAVAILSGVATFIATRHRGRLAGILGGASSGAQIGGAIGGGVGAGIGAGIGAIVGGLFGTGKSDEQKQAEERAAQQAALNLEKTAQDIANAALEGFKKGLEVLEGLADFAKVPERQLQQFMRQYEAIIKRVLAFAGTIKPEALEAGKLFGEATGPMVESLLGALQLFDALPGAVMPANEDVKLFVQAVVELVTTLATELEGEGLKGVKHAAKWSRRAEEIAGMLVASADAFNAIATAKDVGPERMQQFVDSVKATVELVAEATRWQEIYGMKAAARYADRVTAIMNMLVSAAAASDAVATAQSATEDQVRALVLSVKMIVAQIQLAASEADLRGVRYAEQFSNAANVMLQTVTAGVEAVRALNELGGTGFNQAGLVVLGQAIQAVVAEMIRIANQMNQQAVEAAGEFAEGAGKSMDIIGGAVEGMTSLASYTGVMPATIALFGADMQATLAEIIRVASVFNNEIVDATAEFAEGAGIVTGMISGAVEGMTSLQGYRGVIPDTLARFGDDLVLGVTEISRAASLVDKAMLAEAVAFSEKAQVVFEAVRAGVEAFDAIRGYTTVPMTAFQRLLDDFLSAIALLRQLLGQAIIAQSVAEQFRAAAEATAAAVAGGVAAMSKATAAATTALTSNLGQLPTAKIEGRTASTVAAQTSGGNQTTNNFYVDMVVPARDIRELSDLSATVRGARQAARAQNPTGRLPRG